MRKSRKLLAALLCLSASCVASASTVVISDYPVEEIVTWKATTVASPAGQYAKYAGFTLPSGSGYIVDSVKVPLAFAANDVTLTMQLFGGNGAPAGEALLGFHTPELPVLSGEDFFVADDYIFTPLSTFTLLPSRTYWLKLTGTCPADYSDPEFTVCTPFSEAYTTEVAAAWIRNDFPVWTGVATSAGYWFEDTNSDPSMFASQNYNVYEIAGTAVDVAADVPEPATWLSLAGGFTVLLVRRMRRRTS